jgi:hypothetical protein
MNSLHSFKRKMFQLILNILTIFTDLWSGIASVASAVSSFTAKVAQIDGQAAEAVQYSPKSYTANKKKKKREMADNAFKIRGKLSAWAALTGNTTLLNLMKISFYKLYFVKDSKAIINAQSIYDQANALTAAQKTEADITDAEITALNDSMVAYNGILSPEQARAMRKEMNEKLNTLFKEATAILTNSLDGLMYQFEGTTFYGQYINCRPLHPSHRHTTLEGVAVDAETGEDLKDVKVLITSSKDNFEEMTDVQGLYRRQIDPDLNYSVKFILPEYQEEDFEAIRLKKGQHKKLNVKLKKV